MARLALAALAALAAASSRVTAQPSASYNIDDTAGPARMLDGIGGLSGGGATSVFLPSYPEPYRSQILDYLFTPNFGASLQILKVEIGGDAQSTDGSEASHMHDPWTESYERGYEFWLMAEAKKRNPNIQLYGLSWAWPQWISCNPGTLTNCSNDPYTYPAQTATYITKWVSGVKNTYGLDIDFIGSWNERAYNIPYLKTLRNTLDDAGFTNTKIVAPDAGWDIAQDILNDPVLAQAIYGIGCHYPGTHSSSQAEQTGKPLWASEDDSTYNNAVGAACWARVINRNYVDGNMTASINWNLIAAYMKGTNWYRAGIMNAMQPWNGAYGAINADGTFTVGPMVWATAHTTQFSNAGWHYLVNGTGPGTGSGRLQYGGSYATLKNFTSGDFSIVIEKLSRNHSSCVRPGLPDYVTADEVATFTLGGALAGAKQLYLWKTHWAHFPGDTTVEFEQQTPVQVVNNQVTLTITVDSIYTLTTLNTGNKGSYPTPPIPTLFPPAYADDFENCPIPSEAPYFADQNGVWECYDSGDATHGTVMRQMVPLRPITWGGDIRPHSLIGHRDGKDSSLVVDAFIEEPGQSVLLGVRMQGTDNSQGIIFAIDTNSSWGVWSSISGVDGKPVTSGVSSVTVVAGEWHTYRVDVNGSALNVWIDGTPIISSFNVSGMTTSGHAAIGTKAYHHYTQFDNFQLYTRYTQCGNTPLVPGAPVGVVDCSAEVGPVPGSQWVWTPNTPQGWTGMFSLRSNSSLCLGSVANTTGNPEWLTLQVCDSSNDRQTWSWSFDGISPDNERKSQIFNPSTGRCLDIYSQTPDIGNQMDAWPCGGATNQNFWYDHDQGEIGNEWSSTCVGVC